MAANERIEDLISKEALESFDQLNAKIATSVTGIEKLIAAGVKLNGGLGGGGFKKFSDDTKALSENEKALEQQAKQLEIAQAKLNATFTANAEKLAQAKVVSSEVNKQMRDQARDALGLTDAYDRLTRQYNEAAKEAKNLAVTLGANSKEAQEASKRALELDKRLKDADVSVGRFNKNVGNYTGSAKLIVEALEKAKDKFNALSKAADTTPAALNAAKRELDGLQRITENPGFLNVAAKFGDATAEVRGFTNQLVQLEQQGLGNSDVANQLRGRLSELSREVRETRGEIKALASDTREFDLFASSVKFVTASFEAGAGAIELFRGKSEETEEAIRRLVAIQSVANGVQEIAKELTEKGSAANKAYAFTQKQIAILTDSSTAATQRLGAAFKLIGIGLIISAIAFLVINYDKLFNSQKKEIELQNKLNDATKEYNEILVKNNEELSKALSEGAQGLKDQLAVQEKLGANAYDLFKLKKQIAEEEKKASLEALDDLGLTVNGLDKLKIKQDQLNEKLQKAKDLKEKAVKVDLDRGLSQINDQVEALEKQVEANDALIKRGDDLVKTFQDSAEALKLLNVEEGKFSSEEKRKSSFDNSKREIADNIDKNQRIIANDRLTSEVRLIAIGKLGELQRREIEVQAHFDLKTAGKTEAEKATIKKNAAAALVLLNRDIAKQAEDEIRAAAERELAAQFDINKSIIETESAKNQRISDDEKKTFDDRLEANVKYFQAQRDLIEGQKNFDLKNAKLTDTERQAIEQKSNDALLLLQLDFVKKVRDLENAQLETSIQHTIDGNARRRDILLAQVARDRADGLLSEEEYQRKILDVNFRSSQEEIKILINATKDKLLIRQKAGEDVKALLRELAEYEKKLEEDGLQHTRDVEQEKFNARTQAVQKYGAISNNVFTAISELQNIQFDTEKVQVDEAIAAIEKKNEAEIAAVNASTLSQQDKANKIQILNATAAAQKEQQERRLKQIDADKAKFERAITIQRIIADTAAAVIAALGSKPFTPLNIALAASVGVLGAAQLARVLATPLPKFEHGTMDAPGGLALVSEKRRELLVTPRGEIIETPSVPTIMNIPKHSIVFPDSRKMLESGLAVNRRGVLIERNNGKDNDVLGRKIDTLTNVIRNKPVQNISADGRGFTALWQYGASWIMYVDDNTGF